MKKLYEIPIYAINRKELEKRYRGFINEECKKESIDSQEEKQRYIEILKAHYPWRFWDYNHIVGYVVIKGDSQEILFELYLQASGITEKERYLCKTSRKWFLEEQGLHGYHFFVNDLWSNKKIQEEIEDMLTNIIKQHVNPEYIVDREAFDTVNNAINYKKLLEIL